MFLCVTVLQKFKSIKKSNYNAVCGRNTYRNKLKHERKSIMELLELETRAARLEELPGPDKLDWYEQHLFLNLRNIYHMHKIGAMDRDAASKEKKLT